jgi:arylformamidase
MNRFWLLNTPRSPIYDITLPVHPGLAGWPGDAPYRLEWTCTRRGGAAVNLGQIALSIHTGTHVDAPFHFDDGGPTIDRVDLTPYVGPARVVDVSGRTLIRQADLAAIDCRSAPRLLLRTGAWLDPARFPEVIPVMEGGLPDWMAEQGVILVGLDVPSVDALDSKDLPNHHALARHGIAILESLALADVPEGVYELMALPLKLVGADGSPVRALLRHLDTGFSSETEAR